MSLSRCDRFCHIKWKEAFIQKETTKNMPILDYHCIKCDFNERVGSIRIGGGGTEIVRIGFEVIQ